jgi:hypothetical protein
MGLHRRGCGYPLCAGECVLTCVLTALPPVCPRLDLCSVVAGSLLSMCYTHP